MSEITFIGDVHGKIDRYIQLLGDSATFQLGDMGLGFVNLPHKFREGSHRFIRGNHDDPALCNDHPRYAGEFGYDEHRRMFFLGGAWSIDYAWRQAQMARGASPCWWPDEELSEKQLGKAYALYAETLPEIVATHECPCSVTNALVGPLIVDSPYYKEKAACGDSRTSKALQKMFDLHKPKLWVFGHYHVDKELEIEGTKFVCLAELSTLTVEIEKRVAPAIAPQETHPEHEVSHDL